MLKMLKKNKIIYRCRNFLGENIFSNFYIITPLFLTFLIRLKRLIKKFSIDDYTFLHFIIRSEEEIKNVYIDNAALFQNEIHFIMESVNAITCLKQILFYFYKAIVFYILVISH